ncbi:MAG: alpha/beta hydrolase [Chloroflexi bacterium]|nr:MAG: alpha/beta hydrolase [Chloroflexota bacterium]
MSTMNIPALTGAYIDTSAFHADVQYIESLWQRIPINGIDLPIIDIGQGEPLVFVPILEHLEFVYARQIRAFSQSRRVILYRRQENRTRFVGLAERAAELLHVLDTLGLEKVDLVGHGDAAMVLFEFGIAHPQRCRSLTIIAQAADYQIAPHPFIWLLHELFLRLPVEHFLPAWFLRRLVVNYIVAQRPPSPPDHHPSVGAGADVEEGRGRLRRPPSPQLPRQLIDEQFRKIALWPFVYKFSVLPIIHSFDVRQQLERLTMPILLINRADDALSPEAKTRWLAQHLPNCTGYHVVTGGERFFMYAQAEQVNSLMAAFLEGKS